MKLLEYIKRLEEKWGREFNPNNRRDLFRLAEELIDCLDDFMELNGDVPVDKEDADKWMGI